MDIHMKENQSWPYIIPQESQFRLILYLIMKDKTIKFFRRNTETIYITLEQANNLNRAQNSQKMNKKIN